MDRPAVDLFDKRPPKHRAPLLTFTLLLLVVACMRLVLHSTFFIESLTRIAVKAYQ
jgi:hypothetical protein